MAPHLLEMAINPPIQLGNWVLAVSYNNPGSKLGAFGGNVPKRLWKDGEPDFISTGAYALYGVWCLGRRVAHQLIVIHLHIMK